MCPLELDASAYTPCSIHALPAQNTSMTMDGTFVPGLVYFRTSPEGTFRKLVQHAHTYDDLDPSWAILRGGKGIAMFESLEGSASVALILDGTLFMGSEMQAMPCTHGMLAQ